MRFGRAVAAVALLLSACATGTQPSTFGGSPSPIRRSGKARATATESPHATAPGQNAPAQGTIGAPHTAPPAPAESYADAEGVGAMALAYLRARPAARLIVEVDWVRGSAPRQSALDHVEAILERECSKPDGISVIRSDEIPQARSRYGAEDIAALERRYRSHRSAGSTATIWVVYTNGEFADQEGTVGVALTASTAAVFPDQVDSAATALVLPGAIERSVLAHEIGHLLALVNIGYESRHDHEDPDHPKHSRFKRSVMYWAIEDVSVATLLSGGPPDDLDELDRDDLELLRSG